MRSRITVNGAMIYLPEKAVNHISSDNRECLTSAAKNNFWKSYIILLSTFGHLYSFIKTAYLFLFAVALHLWLTIVVSW